MQSLSVCEKLSLILHNSLVSLWKEASVFHRLGFAPQIWCEAKQIPNEAWHHSFFFFQTISGGKRLHVLHWSVHTMKSANTCKSSVLPFHIQEGIENGLLWAKSASSEYGPLYYCIHLTQQHWHKVLCATPWGKVQTGGKANAKMENFLLAIC